MAKSPAWQRSEGKNPKGGLNAKGRASAKAQGMNLKPPVKKAEAKKSPKAAGRRKSFCSRMCGMKSKLTSAKTAKDPNSRINKSLRAWDCKCSQKGKPMAEQNFILMAEPLTPMLAMAREAHKLLDAYQAAGFTRKESFDLVVNQIPEWNFPGTTIIEEEIIEDDEDYELDEEELDDDDVEEGY